MEPIKLTQAEEQILKILWDKEKAFIKEIIEDMSGKKPAYTTVSTIMRILEQKGYVSHESFGKSHRYFPLIKKEQFTKSVISGLMQGYFGGSFKKLVNFISDSNDISIEELDSVLTDLKKQKDGSN